MRLNGQPVHLRTRKMLALLAYLAVEAGPHPRDELAELLWPGPQASARAALRLALHHIQAALGRDTGLRVMRESVELTRHAGLWVDVLRLETGEATPDRPPDPAAVGLWRGDFLQGLSVQGSPSWDDWVGARAPEYAEHFGTLLARLARAQLRAGQVTAASATARRWVEHDPLSEEAYRLLAGAQRAAGLGTRALETERLGREVLRRELAVEPVPGTSPDPPELPRFLVGGPLIGRETEFGRLAKAYGLAAGGAPQAVLLKGEPGIGKTRLAGEVLAWARDRGATLLRGRALETAGAAFAALVEALRREIGALRPRLSTAHLDALARLLPEVQNRPPPPALGDVKAQTLDALSAAVTALTFSLTGEALVLLVDDLQWADASTLEALLHLASRLAEAPAPLLLLLTARSEYLGVGTPLAGALARVRRHLPLHEETLGPLDAGGTRLLLGSALPRAPGALMNRLTAWLHGETVGHPLYLIETLKGLIESGAVTAGPGGWQVDETRLPGGVEGVRAAIGERLSRLTPAALALAHAAAVLGQGATFEVLREVVGLDGEAALTGYEELLRMGLFLEGQGEGESQVALSHDRVRETLRDALSGPRREWLHRRALRTLEARNAPPATLAEHALSGGLTLEAAALFGRAGLAAQDVGANEEALAALERALTLTPARAEYYRPRLQLLSQIADTLFYRDSGGVNTSLERLSLAAATARAAGLWGEQAGCESELARYLALAGRLDDIETHALAARTAAAMDGYGREEARALLHLTELEARRWNWSVAQAYGEQTLRLARSLGPEDEDVAIRAALALFRIARSERGELLRARRQAAALLPRAREFDRKMTVRPSEAEGSVHKVLWDLLWYDLALGRYGEVLEHLDQYDGWLDKDLDLTMRGLVQLRQGNLQGALVFTHSAVELTNRLGLHLPNVYGNWAVCLMKLGRLEEARQALAEGQAADLTFNNPTLQADARLHFGEVLVALGDLDGAQQEYLRAFETALVPSALGGLRGLGQVWARRGDGLGAALCFGAVLSHGAAGRYEERQARATLADLRTRFPADVIDAALAEGATTPLRQVVARVREELGEHTPPGHPPG